MKNSRHGGDEIRVFELQGERGVLPGKIKQCDINERRVTKDTPCFSMGAKPGAVVYTTQAVA